MQITVLTMGSRGDVQPFVALGLGLKAAGHEVTVCASERFGDFVAHRGLRYAHMNDDVIRVVETDEGRGAIEHGGASLSLWHHSKRFVRQSLDEQWQATREADALIYHPYALAGPHIAQKLNIPAAIAAPLPLVSPTGDFPNPLLPWARFGRRANRVTHRAVAALMQAAFWRTVRRWRRDALCLPPLPVLRANGASGRPPTPVLYGHSAHVVPTPTDWPDTTAATGYWFLDHDDDCQPTPELRAFLRSGPPPVYVGFGSMMVRDRERLTRTVLAALRRTGTRAVLAAGWGALGGVALPDGVIAVDSAPHRWLFPRVAAVVHHGGAGTTAAGLRAGRPTVICPFVGDQRFWGQRLHELGVSPRPLPYREVTTLRLAWRIQQAVSDGLMRARAESLGHAIRAEDGVGRAVDLAQTWLCNGRRARYCA